MSQSTTPSDRYQSPDLPPNAVAIVGFSNCGKTELICKLLGLARKRGYRAAAVKHSHKILELDQPGKDTWRFRQAGAQAIALASPGLLQVTQFRADDPPIAAVLAGLPDNLDLVLVEGYKSGPLAKLAFVPPETPAGELPRYDNLLAYISEAPVESTLPFFSRDHASEILDFILQWLKI